MPQAEPGPSVSPPAPRPQEARVTTTVPGTSSPARALSRARDLAVGDQRGDAEVGEGEGGLHPVAHAAGDVGAARGADRGAGGVEVAAGEAGEGRAVAVVDAGRLAQPDRPPDGDAALREALGEEREEALGRADGDAALAVEHHVAVDDREEAALERQEERLVGEGDGGAGGGDERARGGDREGRAPAAASAATTCQWRAAARSWVSEMPWSWEREAAPLVIPLAIPLRFDTSPRRRGRRSRCRGRRSAAPSRRRRRRRSPPPAARSPPDAPSPAAPCR